MCCTLYFLDCAKYCIAIAYLGSNTYVMAKFQNNFDCNSNKLPNLIFYKLILLKYIYYVLHPFRVIEDKKNIFLGIKEVTSYVYQSIAPLSPKLRSTPLRYTNLIDIFLSTHSFDKLNYDSA